MKTIYDLTSTQQITCVVTDKELLSLFHVPIKDAKFISIVPDIIAEKERTYSVIFRREYKTKDVCEDLVV